MAILKTPDTVTGSNDLLRSERIAGGILPKVLNSFDMVVIVVAIILWIPNSAVMAGAGAAAFIYWGLGFITFLIPGAIVTGQLGLMFPGEGSIYVWTTKAFGRFTGFIAGFCAWWPGILVMIAAGDVIVSYIQHLGTLFGIKALLGEPGTQGFVIMVVLVLSYVLSILRFRVTQNLANLVFLAYGCAILLIGLAGVLWLVTGHKASANLSFQSGLWGLNNSNFTFYGTVILALLGIEVPLNMGVEIRDVRSIPRYLLWGSIVVMIAYLITTFAVMAVPLQQRGSLASITEAVQMGFGSMGTMLSAIVDVLLIGFFLIVITVFNYSYARLLFVSGLDRRLPAIISKVSSKRIPWVAVLTQTIIGIAFTAIIFIVPPSSFKSVQLSTVVYSILNASVAVIWCVSMAFLFIDVIIIRRRYGNLFSRIRLAPGWIFYLCSIIGTIASFIGIVVIFTAPWTSRIISTGQWDISIACIAAASLLVAVVGYYIGQRTLKNDLQDEKIIEVVTN